MKFQKYFFLFLLAVGCKEDVVPVPTAPSNLAAQLISGTEVDLTWTDNSTNETGFKIDRKQAGGQYSTIATVDSDNTLYHDVGLTINETYTYRVFSFNKGGNSATYSNEVSILTKSSPILTTTSVSSITTTSGSSGGNITNDGGSTVTARGICWSTSASPTISLTTKTSNGTGSGSFTSSISNLTPGTKYYVRAYATNSSGTGYGDEVSFTTNASLPPTLTTTVISSISYRTASSGGQITADGNAPVTERGVVWGTSNSPTYETNSGKTSNGTGTGSFSSNLTSLQPGTTYYVRAYAKNAGAIGYGDEKSFSTLPLTVPSLTTTQISGITSTTAASGGAITDDGGTSITAKGICWSTAPNPTIALSTKTSNGTGTTTFTSNLSSLTLHVTYYVRAYATNSTGTGYGDEKIFTTKYAIGETGPAGGLIFYDKGTTSDGWRYLEASSNDYMTTIAWWNGTWTYQDLPGISPNTGLGTGKINTPLIVAANNNLSNAAKVCDDYVRNGYTDWYLPSIDEMQLMCQNLYNAGLGSFNPSSYWSSTDTWQLQNAGRVQLGSIVPSTCSTAYDGGRNMTLKVRPIRQF